MKTKARTAQTILGIFCLLVFLGNAATLFAGESELFPRPQSLLPAVTFWKEIYLTYSVGDFLLHDRTRLDLVYEVIRVEAHGNQGQAIKLAEPALRRARAKYQGILTRLAQGTPPAELGADGLRVAEAWGCPCSPELLRRAAENIRVQQGLREQVAQGLERARDLMPRVVPILKKHDLPVELAAIPMVESAWNTKARSKVAAVGLWQFMRATARQYFLRITRKQDERRDPLRATEGAAHLLRDNYAELGSWPLAIVAYNHGTAGIQRAQREIGSPAIEAIIANYNGPRFGFASRNFYPEFLAALEVLQPVLREHIQSRQGESPRDTSSEPKPPGVNAEDSHPIITTITSSPVTAPQEDTERNGPVGQAGVMMDGCDTTCSP